MMKIGLLSDSHRKVDLAKFCIDTLKKNGAQLLLHAGDIVEEETLELLAKSTLDYKAVLGNNDMHLRGLMDKYELYPEPFNFIYKALHIKIMHHPYYLTPDADLIVYGHTHYYEASVNGKRLFINPGEVCARKKPLCECALLHVKSQSWKITRFMCKPKERIWKTQTITLNHA